LSIRKKLGFVPKNQSPLLTGELGESFLLYPTKCPLSNRNKSDKSVVIGNTWSLSGDETYKQLQVIVKEKAPEKIDLLAIRAKFIDDELSTNIKG
jgi:hypothetical protein